MFLRLSVDIVVLVLVFYFCPSSVHVVATFPGTVLFLYYVLCSSFFPNTSIVYLVSLFQIRVSKFSKIATNKIKIFRNMAFGTAK